MFKIEETNANGILWHVVAPPGWYYSRAHNGIRKDLGNRVGPGGPEHGCAIGPNALPPHVFKSHRAAARVRNLCNSSARIVAC